MRLALLKTQNALSTAQKEATTGRLADVGVGLGFRAGQTVSLRNEFARLTAISDTNAIAAARLKATQAALEGLTDDAEAFLGALLGARDSSNGPEILASEARARLASLISAINTAVDGTYLFGGINTEKTPLANYFSEPPPASRQAVNDAFFSTFGVNQSDPAVANIAAADLQGFLEGAFAALFEKPAWSANWSMASDTNVKSRISIGETIETSSNANESAIRKLASAYVMLADLGGENLNTAAFQALVDTAVRTTALAIQELTSLRAKTGVAQERIELANERMMIQRNVLSQHIVDLEGVDQYEASVRVTSLLTQLETAYALTARLRDMSILHYL